MSRVFVAEETSLGRRVVVKVLPPDLAAGVSVGRFRREIQLAARLQHPHIVPLLSAGEADGLLYYTMPFVEGESLGSRIARSGALPVADATALLRDVADALGYAHAQGVVHRDIKPENILLSGRHAFVADFGVAKALSAAAVAAGPGTMTATNMVVGTPRYMAPEQALADAVDHRADIYAFGVVAYETLAGAPPFAGDSFQRLVAAHVAHAPEPLDARRADLPQPLAGLVMRCLAKAPGERPQSADEILRALAEIPAARAAPSVPPTASPPRARLARTPQRVAAFVLALATVGALGGAAWRRTHRPPPPPALDSRRVLVVAFANRTGDRSLDDYGSMAADWIAQGISETGVAEVVSPLGGVAALAASGQSGAPPAELAREARAGKVLTGAVYRTGDSLRLHAQLGDVNTGEVRWAIEPVSVPASNPMSGIAELRQRVTGALALELEGRQLWGSALRSPPSFAAYQAFTDGTEAFFRGDFAGATRELLHAYELDSTFVVALTWAAQAQYNLGHYAQADTILARAQRSPGVTPLFRGSFDYLLGAVHGDQPRALAGAREMARVAPHSEAQLMVVQQAARSNRPREAIAAARELSKYRGWTRRFASSWGWTTMPYHMLGQHEEELRLARLGRAEFPNDLNLASREAFALAALGRADSAIAVVRALPLGRGPAVSTPVGVAEQTADELRAHGGSAAAADTLDRLALEWARAAASLGGARQATPRARYALARALCRTGDRASGLAVLDSLVFQHPDTIDFRGLQGTCAAGAGDRVRATRALEALTAIDRPYLFGSHLFWAARVAAALGDRDRAVTLLRQAFGRGLSFGIELHRTREFAPLRGYPPFDELLRPQG